MYCGRLVAATVMPAMTSPGDQLFTDSKDGMANELRPGRRDYANYRNEGEGKLLGAIVLASAAYSTTKVLNAFVGTPSNLQHTQNVKSVALQARGGGEYDVSDADIENFYAEITTGSGGLPPKGNVVSEMVVKFFHGEFTKQGFKRYSGMWKGPPPGTIGKKDIAVGIEGLKEQMKNPMFVSKGGVGYGVDETQKVEDDGKGWVWLGAEMSPGGLALELFKSVPYGKRAVLVAKQDKVDELFEKVNWEQATVNIDKTLGGPQLKPIRTDDDQIQAKPRTHIV